MYRLVKCFMVLSIILFFYDHAYTQPSHVETSSGCWKASNLSRTQMYPLCIAYCVAMECDHATPQATESACNKVKTWYKKTQFGAYSGDDPPCEEDNRGACCKDRQCLIYSPYFTASQCRARGGKFLPRQHCNSPDIGYLCIRPYPY